MTRPVLKDLFCGAGGAGMGYYQAGFDVIGYDYEPQPHYPFPFVLANAFEVRLDGADAFHASPICKDHSLLRNATKRDTGTAWQIAAIRERLMAQSAPWVIENVPRAPIRPDYKLCGCMFGLPGLRRERWFETSWHGFQMRPPCQHEGETVTVAGHGAQGREYEAGIRHDQAQRRAAMGIDWMNRDELAQAIPPAMTKLIGTQLLTHLGTVAA